MKLKPKLMLFDTSIQNKDTLMQNNLLVKVMDPVFLEEVISKK